MHPQVKKDLRAVLEQAFSAIKNKRYFELRGLSDHVIHSMSIFQERDISDCAISIYALSKIFDKEQFTCHGDCPRFIDQALINLSQAKNMIEKNNMKGYRQAISNLLTQISKFDSKLKLFERPILDYARLQKASKLAEHGLSVSAAAELMNIPKWELSGYLGNTKTSETCCSFPEADAKRVSYVFKLFGVKQ